MASLARAIAKLVLAERGLKNPRMDFLIGVYMSKEILINSGIREVRAAVLTGGNVSEIFIERVNKKSAAGNIYKGKVVKVLPGMQSAFVEIGLQRAAFLHIADIYTGSSDELSYEESMPEDDSEARVSEEIHSEQQHYAPIAEILTEGQEIIVQVAKDAIAAKGARLTTHLTIPGRYLVLMPGYEHIGVSRKIENEAERERLKDILTKLRPESMGLIARTVSDGLSLEELMADLEYIKGVWAGVEAVTHSSTAPSLLYEDHNLIYKILRDVVTADTTRILIDNKADYDKMQEFFVNHLSNLDLKIEYYQGDEPLFDLYNVEIEVNRLLDKKVWLRSGGSIVIDQAEALTVIDVNTGKYVGRHNFDDTILKTNLEASKEIAHQLKMRNIGGIIIVDFIDMERVEDREKVLTTLEQYLKEDRAKTSVVNISPLGLVEITRKRVRDSVTRIISEACPYCEGRGVIKSKITVCYEIMRQLTQLAAHHKGANILIDANVDVADLILEHERESIDNMEQLYGVHIEIQQNNSGIFDRYKLKITGYNH